MENEAKLDEPYNVYEHLKSHDVLDMLRPLLDGGSYTLRQADGKLEVKQVQASRDTPWIHVRHSLGYDCHLWNKIIFDIVVKQLPEDQKFVPRHCQGCWKVVVKPRTLQQLFNLLEMQKELDLPSKCGIEVRDSVPGLYGGYFYNKSIEAGLECYDVVKKSMSENDILTPLLEETDKDNRTTRLILKRACTEFEHAVGDSDKWEITTGQNAVEDLIEQYIVHDSLELRQAEHLTWNIKRRWIEWAWKNGDPTYANYTGGKPLYPAYVTYHQKEAKK